MQGKSGILIHITSYKKFNSYEMFNERKRKKWTINTGNRLIEVITGPGFNVLKNKCFRAEQEQSELLIQVTA